MKAMKAVKDMNAMNVMKEVNTMKRYRIYKAVNGFDVYQLKDEGNGWSKEYHSHYDTREAAEQAIQQLKELLEQDSLLNYTE